MNIKKFFLGASLATSIVSSAFAASVTVTGNGSTIIINKNGGFDGVDGAGREAAFVAAAQVWADILVSSVDIVIDAEFSSSLFCDASSATLGSAGPQNTYLASGAESFGLQNNVWYPSALINAHYGSDLFAGSADITAQFNADIGDSDCLSSSGWYYGMDGNTPFGQIDFYEVVVHELGHGLGILSLVYSDGSYPSGNIDIFSTFLRDQDSSTDWLSMSSGATRAASITDTGNLVWKGAEVTALAGSLTSGVNGGYVQMYAPNPYESGSSVSHFDTALTPNELMEPQYTGDSTHHHSEALLKDIGWTLYQSSNDSPDITGQVALAVDEDNSLTFAVTDLTISDSDDSSFTLTVNNGTNYSVSGNTITPAANFNGTLTVPVTVNDGEADSPVFNAIVTVNPINDVPVISGQSSLSAAEDNALTLSASDLTITDPDDSNFTLAVDNGSNYAVSGVTITPSANFNGTLTVPVTVNDGEVDSTVFNLTVTVTSVNDVPVITAQSPLSVLEDTSLMLLLSNLTISDPDDSSFTLKVGSGANYSLSGATITPAPGFNGILTVPVVVNDGEADSASFNLSITVTDVNNIPVITAHSSFAIDEDTSLSLSVGDLTITDNDDTSFKLTVYSGNHYSFSGTTITPESDFSGTLTVPVTVNDGDNESALFNLSVTVNPVNDIPVITAQSTLEIDEDETLVLSVANLTITDPDDGSFTLVVNTGANYSVSGSTITPSRDFNGTLLVPVAVSDGEAESVSFAVSIIVNPINDAPVLTGSPGAEVLYTDDYSASFSASDVDADTLFYSVVSNHSWLSIDSNGLLTGSPTAADIGADLVTVTVSDGSLSDDLSFILTVVDSGFTDVSAGVEVSTAYATTAEQASITVTITNHGPANRVSGFVDVTISGASSVPVVDNACVETGTYNWRCDYASLISNMSFVFGVSSNVDSVITASAKLTGLQTDGNSSNDWADNAVTVDNLPAQPENPILFASNINSRAALYAEIQNTTMALLANDLLTSEQQLSFDSGVTAVTDTKNFASNQNAFAIAVDDFNDDEFLDVVFAGESGSLLYLQSSDGRWSTPVIVDTEAAQDVVAADFNGDEIPDLVFALNGKNHLYLNDGLSHFTLAQSVGDGHSSSISLIDYNVDGWPDLLITNRDDDDYIYLNRGMGQNLNVFDSSAIVIGVSMTDSTAAIVADLDGDGVENDFAITRTTAEGVASLVAYHVSGNVISVLFTRDAGDLISVASGDFDRDGETDLVAVNDQGVVFIWLLDGGAVTGTQSLFHEGANAVYFNDLDQDGFSDLMILSDEHSASVVYVSKVVTETQGSGGSENNGTDIGDNSSSSGSEANTDTEDSGSETPQEESQTVEPNDFSFHGSLGWFTLLLSVVLLKRRGYRPSI
jgi:Na+-translocating ferredoxin:NAD+ oxidoreductase RnfG subunit